MPDRVGLLQPQAPRQEFAAPRGVHHPLGLRRYVAAIAGERERVGAIVGEGNLQVRDRGTERELRVLAVQTQELGFELVAVELIGSNIGKRAEVCLTVVLKAVILPSGSFPVEAQVVLHKVLAEQVFLHVEHLREVIAPHL